MAKRIVPFAVLTVVVGALAASVLRAPASAEGFDVDAFRRLPVSVNGRVQPFDSVAKVALKRIRGSETVPDEGDGPTPSSLALSGWALAVAAMVVGWFRLRTSPTPKPRTEREGISLSQYFGAGRSLRTE